MGRKILDLVLTVVVVMVLLAIVAGGVLGGIYAAEAHACNSKTNAMEVEHRYGLFEGCLIKVDDEGDWIPLDNYRVQEDA